MDSVYNSSVASTVISEVVILAFIHFMCFIALCLEPERCGAVRSAVGVVGSSRESKGLTAQEKG